jgi:hypothetical protein
MRSARPRISVAEARHSLTCENESLPQRVTGTRNALTCDVAATEPEAAEGPAAAPCPPGAGGSLRKHGLWPQDIARLREAQQDRCYLCGGPLPVDGYMLAIDHDHRCCPPKRSCGYCRRGLACHSCNVLIGHAHDDPQVLRRIADNLEAAIADVTRRLAVKPALFDLQEPKELEPLTETADGRKSRAKRPKVKVAPEQPEPGRRNVLSDVLTVFERGESGLHWQDIAERLAARIPDRWAGAPKGAVSAQVRALGVPGVNIRYPVSRGGMVLWGCRRADVEAAMANRDFWAGW